MSKTLEIMQEYLDRKTKARDLQLRLTNTCIEKECLDNAIWHLRMYGESVAMVTAIEGCMNIVRMTTNEAEKYSG